MDEVNKQRHSLAHIMANAVQHLWPEAKFGVGPVIENGFYYDIDLGKNKISEEDFGKIEAEMKKIRDSGVEFVKSDKPIDEAIAWAKQNSQPYKEELLNDLKRAGTTVAKDLDTAELGLPADASKVESVSFYQNGDFTDLCRGPHVATTKEVGAFKLTKVAGAYWRGKETNPQMQRIYGVAFANQKELDDYLKMLEEAKARDHRKLGQELDLFVFSDLVGSGLPLFTPRGTILREELTMYSNELRTTRGFQKVWIPHMTKNVLYKTSGHWDKFGDELFLVKSQETSDELVLKPMNCPHHTQIYASRPRSYKELPLKFLETTTIYRDEKTGELHGLSRVRSITQDDSHVFCRPDQIAATVEELIRAAQEMYGTLDMEVKFRLSFRDESDAYFGSPELWENAQKTIEELAKSNNLDYFIAEGEAAFYGPKIDFMAVDAIGRQWQVATVQLDFVQPERFGLEYTDHDGKLQRPVMIHCALLGSIERFLSIYIEHTAGKFPLWLAPEQLRVITLNDDESVVKAANDLVQKAKEQGLRAVLDESNESVGKRIREAEVMKVPYTVVIGGKEVQSGQVTPRVRSDLPKIEQETMKLEDFLAKLTEDAKSRK